MNLALVGIIGGEPHTNNPTKNSGSVVIDRNSLSKTKLIHESKSRIMIVVQHM